MNVRGLVAKLGYSLRSEGVYPTLRKAFIHFTYGPTGDDAFDEKYGTDTGGLVPLWKVSVPSANARYGRPYRATTEDELTQAVALLSEDLAGFTFVDLGCGKGRTLLVASMLGFQSVIGIDFAKELVAIAQANIRKMGIANATVVDGDVTEFEFPKTNLVVYLYNPFAPEVMTRVIAALERHARNPPCLKLYVIYKNPLCADIINGSRSFAYFASTPDHGDIILWQAVAWHGGAASGS